MIKQLLVASSQLLERLRLSRGPVSTSNSQLPTRNFSRNFCGSQPNRKSGFTLVEMLVAIGLFAIVMVVCIGTLLSLVNANKKAQALESVINNLNITLDSMTRGIRAGAAFDGSVGCSDDTGGGPKDCTVSGTRTFSFVPYGGDPAKPTTYAYVDNGTQGCVTSTKTGGCIVRQENGGGFTVMTAPEVAITAMKFYVVGTVSGRNGDIIQPRVIITIQGTAGAGNAKTVTTFHLQTSSTQRLLDL